MECFMNVLAINCGSSAIEWGLSALDAVADASQSTHGRIERRGSQAVVRFEAVTGERLDTTGPVAAHDEGSVASRTGLVRGGCPWTPSGIEACTAVLVADVIQRVTDLGSSAAYIPSKRFGTSSSSTSNTSSDTATTCPRCAIGCGAMCERHARQTGAGLATKGC